MYLLGKELWMGAAVLDGCAYLILVGMACIGPLRRKCAFAVWPTAVLAMAFTYLRHAMFLCETAYAPLGPPNRIDSLMLVNLDPFALAALVSIVAAFRICQRFFSSSTLLCLDGDQGFTFPIAATFSYKTLTARLRSRLPYFSIPRCYPTSIRTWRLAVGKPKEKVNPMKSIWRKAWGQAATHRTTTCT